MAEQDRWEKGLAKFKEVYCGDVVALPRGASDFFDLMIENLFGEVWRGWAIPSLAGYSRDLDKLGASAPFCRGHKAAGVFAGIGGLFAN